ncbi:MAG TPA: glycosyltransferase [Acidimicrobiales bacterium]|nr:glycosyltransferase [Acidimicrobiales bacterium]
MKALFSSTPGDGHINPLLPLSRTFAALGHQVAFATSAEHAAKIGALGFTWFACGPDGDTLKSRFRSHLSDRPALASIDFLPFVISRRYAIGDAPERVADLRAIVDAYRPDLLVFESCDLATPIVSAATGIPGVHHSFGRAIASACYAESAPYVEPLWGKLGANPPPLCGMYENNTFVDICPTSIQGSGVPASAVVRAMSPASPPPPETPPAWLTQLPDRPSAYVTLGTVFNRIDHFRVLIEAFADTDCNLILTIGNNNDPSELGPQPPNVFIERFVAQALLLPHMSAMVNHAGSGSMLAALSHAVPMLMLPQGSDQYENSLACTSAGVARMLTPDVVTPDLLAVELRTILSESSYTRCARAIRDEIDAMPTPADVAAAIDGAQA